MGYENPELYPLDQLQFSDEDRSQLQAVTLKCIDSINFAVASNLGRERGADDELEDFWSWPIFKQNMGRNLYR